MEEKSKACNCYASCRELLAFPLTTMLLWQYFPLYWLGDNLQKLQMMELGSYVFCEPKRMLFDTLTQMVLHTLSRQTYQQLMRRKMPSEHLLEPFGQISDMLSHLRLGFMWSLNHIQWCLGLQP